MFVRDADESEFRGEIVIYNNQAKEIFGEIDIKNIEPNDKYLIWEKLDDFGRTYYGVSHFWNQDSHISDDTDLSWLEWDGNEVYIDFTNPALLESKYADAVSILKSWKSQLEKYSDSKFRIILSYDNGDLLDEENGPYYSFTLRFWKKRSESELITNIDDFVQPIIMEYCN